MLSQINFLLENPGAHAEIWQQGFPAVHHEEQGTEIMDETRINQSKRGSGATIGHGAYDCIVEDKDESGNYWCFYNKTE